MAQLSEWLQLMLAEIVRKQEEAQHVGEQHEQRKHELPQPDPQSPPRYLSTQT
jgi:hypothetical protein